MKSNWDVNISKENNKGEVIDKLDYSSINLHLKPLEKTESNIETGLPVSHQQVLTNIANKENIIIGIRPIDPKSTSLIESGEYSSKGLSIKGKSSDWGPHSGFIPVKQKFAKKSGRENASKFDEYIQMSIQEGNAKSIHLEISEQRINELIGFKTISPLEAADKNGFQRIISTIDGHRQEFFIKKNNDNSFENWKIYYRDNGQLSEFHVLGDPKTGKPITADYDLFSIIFPISDLEHYVKVKEMPSWHEWKASVNYDDLTLKEKRFFHDETEYNHYEGRDNGYTNKKIKELKNIINHKLGRRQGFELVHHGADDANPASDINDNFPITFFIPENLKGINKLKGSTQSIDTYFHMNEQGSIIISDVEQLSNFQQLLINQGYRTPLNKKWSEGDNSQYFDPKRKLSASFIEGRDEIIRKKSISNNDSSTEKPAVQLDTDFDDIYLNMEEGHKNSRLPESHSPNMDNLDIWLDPMLIYPQNKANDAETNRQAKPTEYTYNVIIQNGGDTESAEATAHAFSKHPEGSMIIQYDMGSKQYKILHGDLNKINVGKVRWITIGHGYYYSNNLPTLYMEKNAQQYVDALMYLRRKVLKNTTPDKLVMLGCNLGRGGVNENFALKATSLLAEYNVRAPIVAYNRQVGNMYLGSKVIYPIDFLSDTVNTQGYKFVYQYHSGSEQVRINNNSSTLYFINELRRGELSLTQLNDYTEPDPMHMFRDPDTRILDNNLLKKVAYNHDVYKLFVQELKNHKSMLPSDFYTTFSTRLNEIGIIDIPIWKMVNSQNIQKKSLTNTINYSEELFVIIRLTGDKKGLLQAESLAARSPQNTLIFQMDADSKKHILEYGKEHLMSLVEKQKITNWVMIGDTETVRKPIDILSNELSALKKKYPWISPDNILFHSVGPAMITEAGEHKIFLSSLSDGLKLQGVNCEVKSKFTYEVPNNLVVVNGDIPTTTLTSHSNQQLVFLLEKIALKDINIKNINLENHPYLKGYFTDENGTLNHHKLVIAANDPLISPKVNQFFKSNNTTSRQEWVAIFSSDLSTKIQTQAHDACTILQALNDGTTTLKDLSLKSRNQLESLFPSISGLERGKILSVVNNENEFLLLKNHLIEISQLNDSDFTDKSFSQKSINLKGVVEQYKNLTMLQNQQFNSIVNQKINKYSDIKLNKVNHNSIRGLSLSTRYDVEMGLLYGVEFQLAGENSACLFFERKTALEQKQQQGMLSDGETELLQKIQSYSENIIQNITKNGIEAADQSILSVIDASNRHYHTIDNSILIIKGKSVSYTVNHSIRDGNYIYSLYDPNGFQLSIKNADANLAKKQFHQFMVNYFNDEIILPDGKKITRSEYAGFSSDSNGRIRADIQFIDIDVPAVQQNLGLYKTQKEQILKNKHFSDPVNCWVYIDGEKISLSKLQRLGVTIDGRSLTVLDTTSEGWSHKVRFNAEKLAAELTMLQAQSDDGMSLLKILHKRSHDVDSIINYEADFKNTYILKKQLKIIAKDIDIQNGKQSTELITNLHKAGTKLSRFQRIGNRAGQVMGGVGAVQTLISLHSLINQLDNPDLTDEERLEVEKQLYITCGSAFANYGDMMLQPVLLKIANSARASSLVCSRLAAGVVIVFNLVGMGFDAYQAYDNLSKLDSVTDPKQRQDLMVNAALSIASFVVNGVTVVGVLIASSTIPVMGLVIGGILLVGGWVYNGVRAVENIKQQIDISWSRELEEGIRGAIGLEPTLRTRNELAIAQYIELFKQEEWLKSKGVFKQIIGPEGFQHHLKIIEKPITEPEERFYLVCDGERKIAGYKTDYFGGTKKTSGYNDEFVEYTKQGAPSFTQEEIDILQTEYVLNVNGEVRKRTSFDLPSLFRTERKPVLDRKLVGTESSSEYFNLNRSYNSILLSEFRQRHKIKGGRRVSTFKKQLEAPGIGEPKLYAVIKKFKRSLEAGENSDPYHYVGMEFNDTDLIRRTIIEYQDGGSSFNTGNGIDIIIGKKNQANAFQISSGGKYLAGGNKNDIFYLNDKNILTNKPSDSLGKIASENYKYLDGQDGNDTLIIKDKANSVKHITVDLASEHLSYSSGRNLNDLHENVANIKSIENIIIWGHKTDDEIDGNEGDNILDGGYGNDEIRGYEGNDKLLLSYGNADGGDGDDTYFIRRYDWEIEAENHFSYKKEYNADKKIFEQKRVFNDEHDESHNRVLNIHEDTVSSSIVNLGYDLSEIKQVYVEENNLILEIAMPVMNFNGKELANFNGHMTINLKNVYIDSNEGKKRNHNYQIRTRDGFLLNSKLKDIDNQSTSEIEGNIFDITYLQLFDQKAIDNRKSVYISASDSAIILGGDRVYVKPSWGDFKWLGLAEDLTYEGSSNNDVINYVSGGNNIKVSLGQDIYRLDNIEFYQQEIVFDFSTVRGLYGENDKVVLLLPTINAFELQMEGSKIVLKDRFNITTLSIRLENFDESMQHAVVIQDKHSNLFNVNLRKGQCAITPIVPVSKETDDSDAIVLPKGYIPKNGLINGLGGDDAIINYSSHESFISGGLGDDIITSAGKFNVLYGGTGENELTGGEGDDLLLSSTGFDTLQGGKGDDHYLIDGSQAGLVYVDDLDGNNHIHLINFKSEAIIEENDNIIYHRYLSSAGKIVVIKRSATDKNQVHLYSAPSDHLRSLMQGDMDKLFNYLHSRFLEERSMGNSDWEPIFALEGDLKGIAPQGRVAIDVENIQLTLSARNDVKTFKDTEIKAPWLVNALDGNDSILDQSKQGRIIKGGKGHDELITIGGENVLYGGKGNDKLIGGENRDLLVSTGGADRLLGGKSNDVYLVYGDGEGDVNIYDSEGNNHVFLINFKHDSLIEELTPQGYTKTSIQSSTGRWVHIHHQNHLMLTGNQTNIQFHHKTHESWRDKSEQTVDKLIQLMVEQRYAYESSADNALKTQLAEKRLTHFEWVDNLVNGKI